jgi:cyanate lyase
MTRAEATARVLEAKRQSGLSWRQICGKIGHGSPLFYTAALLGHHGLTPEEASKVTALLKFDDATATILAEIPESRGASLAMPPSDPLIYRLYEIVQGYGPTLKALINEEFGDGIMSAIDFTMDLEREPDPKGDRVKITMSGKFLPYKRF